MTDQIRKCGHPLGSTRWCPDCELAEAMATGEFATPLPAQVQPAEQVEEPEQRGYVKVIDVEKLLCGKLGIEWTPAGISIASLVERLASSAQQQPVSADLRPHLQGVLQLARLKWGNLDADANRVFEQAEAALTPPQAPGGAA